MHGGGRTKKYLFWGSIGVVVALLASGGIYMAVQNGQINALKAAASAGAAAPPKVSAIATASAVRDTMTRPNKNTTASGPSYSSLGDALAQPSSFSNGTLNFMMDPVSKTGGHCINLFAEPNMTPEMYVCVDNSTQFAAGESWALKNKGNGGKPINWYTNVQDAAGNVSPLALNVPVNSTVFKSVDSGYTAKRSWTPDFLAQIPDYVNGMSGMILDIDQSDASAAASAAPMDAPMSTTALMQASHTTTPVAKVDASAPTSTSTANSTSTYSSLDDALAESNAFANGTLNILVEPTEWYGDGRHCTRLYDDPGMNPEILVCVSNEVKFVTDAKDLTINNSWALAPGSPDLSWWVHVHKFENHTNTSTGDSTLSLPMNSSWIDGVSPEYAKRMNWIPGGFAPTAATANFSSTVAEYVNTLSDLIKKIVLPAGNSTAAPTASR